MTGFKNFIMRGNLVALAVAVVIGTQFSSLVKQFVSSFVNPLLSLVGQRCPECTAEITPATDQPQPVGRLVRRHRHLCCRLQTMMEPMRMALATTASSGQRRCITWLCLTFGLAHLRGG